MSAATPKVAIGMPVYNGGASLQHSIESLLRQSHTDFELIIADNASSDGTYAKLLEFAARDSRIKVQRHSTNIGAFANFKHVLNCATSPYFMWASADDSWREDHVANLVAELEGHPSAAVAMSATRRRQANGELLDVVRYTGARNPNLMSELRLAFRLAAGELYHLYIYGLFRTEFLQCMFADLPNVKGIDRQFICRVALAAPVRYVDEISYERQTYDVASAQRYVTSDPQLARLYSDAFGMFKATFKFGPYLLRSPRIRFSRKAWVPLLVLRYAAFVAHSELRNIAHRLISRHFPRILQNRRRGPHGVA